MDPRKEAAKQLLANKQFAAAKALILQMVDDGNAHYKTFQKLGDISLELDQHEEALQYYLKAKALNPENAVVLVKLGDVYHEYLDDHDKAQQLYSECIGLEPMNELCLFKLGKLLFKAQRLDEAEHCFLKCTTPRACVYYQYALL